MDEWCEWDREQVTDGAHRGSAGGGFTQCASLTFAVLLLRCCCAQYVAPDEAAQVIAADDDAAPAEDDGMMDEDMAAAAAEEEAELTPEERQQREAQLHKAATMGPTTLSTAGTRAAQNGAHTRWMRSFSPATHAFPLSLLCLCVCSD